jgi:hypothetical protein
MRDDIEHFPETAVFICGIIPAVESIDLLEPHRSWDVRIDHLPCEKGGALCSIDMSLTSSTCPVVNGRLVMVDATDGENTRVHPLLPNIRRNGDIDEVNSRALHNIHLGPSTNLVRRDREHVNGGGRASIFKGSMKDVGGEPAIDTIAMKENGGIRCGVSGHC